MRSGRAANRVNRANPAAMGIEGKGAEDYRLLVLAPTRRDREAVRELLQRAQIDSEFCDNVHSLCAQLDSAVGAVLLTDEVLRDLHLQELVAALAHQPPWSDVPIIFLYTPAQLPAATRVIKLLHNVTALERPPSSRTLVSSIQAALRARARQYQMRRQFELLRQSEASHEESERRFRTMTDAIPQLAWSANADGHIHWFNRRWYEYTGTAAQDVEGWGWQRVIDAEQLPTVLERWRRSIATGIAFDMAFPLRAADGRFRMFLTRIVPMKDALGEVTQWFGTSTDIDESKQTENKLRATEAALRESDQRKDIFLATLAHELRNPLAPIRSVAQLLGSPALAPQQLQFAQSVIQRQVKHMAWLLDDLLDVARITQGKLALKIERVTLTSIVDAAVETSRPLLDSKSHHLVVNLPAQEIQLDADPLRLSQVLSNLLTNAAKYTDAGGHIELSGAVQAGQLLLTVKDNGIGIAPDALQRIFTMFSQVDGASVRAEGGLGIGLALAKGLIELHGGAVDVRSVGLGHGSAFTARLPLTVFEALAADPPCTSTPEPQATGRRILVADDNKDAADALAMILEIAGHEVRVAHNGRIALAIAQTFRPEVALLDIGMPEMSGYEVARALRHERWGRDIYLIALTGWGQEGDRQQAADAGFDRHLTKPIDPDALEVFLSNPRQPAVGAMAPAPLEDQNHC